MDISINQLKQICQSKDYRFFMDQSKNFNLNIFGIRTADSSVNTFNDWIVVVWKYNEVWNKLQFRCTTDPGLYWLNNPGNVNGTAIVKPGQYRGLWQIGKHQGKYEALTQKGNVTVIRDRDEDNMLDTTGMAEETGIFGINLHRASATHESTQVDKWSAGCQVIANPDNFNLLMDVCKRGATIWGNSFTYTLITEADL